MSNAQRVLLSRFPRSLSLAPLYLAIDQGTHASRAVVLDHSGRVLANGARDIGMVRPQPDWAEQDGD